MATNGALAVFIERRWEPHCATIRQRTKAGIEVIKPRIDQLDGNNKACKHFGDGTVRLDIAAKFVTAKERIATEESVPFSLEIQFFRQPENFISVRFHPAREVRRLPGPFLVPKIARNKLPANGEAGIRRENHIGQFRLWRDQFDFGTEGDERFK